MHWVPTGQTVNKEYYIVVLREFSKRFRRKKPALFMSVAFLPGQCTSLQLHPCHRLFDQDVPLPPYSPVTFGYSLSSEAVVMRELRRWKRLWRRPLTRSNKTTSMGPPEVVGTVEQVHCSRRRLLWRGLEFHVCTINKSALTKKVWKLI